MPVVLIESHREWATRQGGHAVRLGSQLLYPSGAVCADDDSSREEPPCEPHRNLVARRRYHAARLQRTEGDFLRLKEALTGKTGLWTWPTALYGPALPSGTEALRHLQSLVFAERDQVERLDAEIADLPEERERRRREESLSESRLNAEVEAASLRAEAAAVEI